MAAGDVYSVKSRYFLGSSGKTVAPGFHIRQDDSTEPDVEIIAINVKTMWTSISEHFSSDTSLEAVTLRKVVPLEPLEHIATTGLPLPGTGAAASDLPPGSAVVVSLRTDFIGRSYRGRHFLPAVAEADSDGSLLLAAAEDIADAWQTMIADLSADENPMVIRSHIAGRGPTEVKTALVDRRFRSQRRRQQRNPTYSGG